MPVPRATIPDGRRCVGAIVSVFVERAFGETAPKGVNGSRGCVRAAAPGESSMHNSSVTTQPRFVFGAILALLFAGCGDGVSPSSEAVQQARSGAAQAPGALEIRTLGNRADLISDGDALVEVTVPQDMAPGSVKVTVNDRDVTAGFVVNTATHSLRGVLQGLEVGQNLVEASAPKGRGNAVTTARLTVTNHPRGGPVILSTQTQPWVCATPTPVPQSGNTPASNASGLSTFAVDAQCNIATEFKLFYRTKTSPCSTALPDPNPPAAPPANACFKPYTPGITPADLVATTTTTEGATVPYIVRVERGTMNRGIYDIVVLFDPTRPQWTALHPQPQWNGKVVYSFGASTGQPRLQFRTEQNWADDSALSRGFMVVDNSLTDSLFNSNRVLVAETVMMMKEHITDTYGEIKYTMGNGCSGGSIQQNTVSSIWPGLLDGIQPSCDYPDSITTGSEVSDCVLLVNFYASEDWLSLQKGLTQDQINAKKTAINGHLDQRGCQSWNNSFGFNNKPGNYVRTLVADQNTGALVTETTPRNNCLLPAALVYDPATNPTGTRCGDPDLASMVWGTTVNELAPAGTRALQTGDNVGIQYGLKALLSGAISAEEFVTLNEKIGGSDTDSNLMSARSTADLAALDIAYRAGIVSSGKNLGKLPIIDSRGYDEQGIHYIWRSFSERARIDGAYGNHDNQVMWRYGTALLPATPAQAAAVTLKSFLTMDNWLSGLLVSAPKQTLNSVRTHEDVVAAKPASAVDFCFLTGDVSFSTPIFDQAVCDADARLAKHTSPRQVAGGSIEENILKCQLKPLDAADYPAGTFSSAQWKRLEATFPNGVCDWSQPGVGQRDPQSPLTFDDGPGGHPMPPAPTSHGG